MSFNCYFSEFNYHQMGGNSLYILCLSFACFAKKALFNKNIFYEKNFQLVNDISCQRLL